MTATILTILILAAPAAAHAHAATGNHAHGETLVGAGWCLVAALITWSLIRARVRR